MGDRRAFDFISQNEGRRERQKAPPDRLASPEAIIQEHEVQHKHIGSLRGGASRVRRPRRQHRRRSGAAESDCEIEN